MEIRIFAITNFFRASYFTLLKGLREILSHPLQFGTLFCATHPTDIEIKHWGRNYLQYPINSNFYLAISTGMIVLMPI